jgi:hypothetical protein
MGVNFFKDPVAVNLRRVNYRIDKQRQAADFRIDRVPVGQERLFFKQRSQIRTRLTQDIQPTSLSLENVLEKAPKLFEAPPFSIVAETDNLSDAALIMVALMRTARNTEFMAVTSANDGKTYIVKGSEGGELVPLQQFLQPFNARGPIINIHPLRTDPMPSLPDYEHLMRNGLPFGIVLGFDETMLTKTVISKFCTVGPFREIAVRFVKQDSVFRALLNALSKDSAFSRAYYYLLRNNPDRRIGLLAAREHEMIAQYRKDMNRWGDRIASLEKELYLNPTAPQVIRQKKKGQYTVTFPALELADLYQKTQHFTNAILLLDKFKDDKVMERIKEAREDVDRLLNCYPVMQDLTIEDIRNTLPNI